MSDLEHPHRVAEEAEKITVRQYSMESIKLLDDLRPILQDASAKLAALEDRIQFHGRYLNVSKVIEARAGHRMIRNALRSLEEAQQVMRLYAEDLP